MIPAERQKKILNYINNNGSANIEELINLVGVSKSTVRRDLKKLSKKGLINRTHGGAIKKTKSTSFEPSPKEKRFKQLSEKKKIAKITKKYIRDGESIILDAGSTNYAISQELEDISNITVITFDLRIALETKLSNDSRLVVPGGVRRENYEVLIGSHVENFFRDVTADKAFLGADAVSLDRGITNATFSEVAIKKQIINSAKETYLVVDHTKFGNTTLVKVAELSVIDYIITDSKIKPEIENKLKKLGVLIEK
ncbi:MAG: DeoR/GlpR family DNA-binding transcription regulator [Halanaerobiales bacterium]